MSQYLKVQEERDLGISDERPSLGRGNSRWKGGGEAVGGCLRDRELPSMCGGSRGGRMRPTRWGFTGRPVSSLLFLPDIMNS